MASLYFAHTTYTWWPTIVFITSLFLGRRRCSSPSSGTNSCLDTMTNVAYLCLWSPSCCCSAPYTLRDRSACRLWIIQLVLFSNSAFPSSSSSSHPFDLLSLALPAAAPLLLHPSNPSAYPHSFLSSSPFSLWSGMESSDDDTLSERSCLSEPSFRSERSGGSLSPCPSGTTVGLPGDTLPWNLSKHERRKRKSQASVLDPAERAVVRVAGKEQTTTLS